MSSSLSSQVTSSFPSTLAPTATTVAAPSASCPLDKFTSPPGGNVLRADGDDAVCAVYLYSDGYSVGDATAAIQQCCGNSTISYYTNGCGLYCHASNGNNATDYTVLQACLRDKISTVFCESQHQVPSSSSSSSSATSPPATSGATTSASPPTGAAAKALDTSISKVGGMIALLLTASFVFGTVA